VKTKIQNSMKRCCFTVLACFFLVIASAQSTNQSVINNGRWNNNLTWGLGHTPQNGEVGIVPQDDTVIVDDNVQITTDITLKVYGNLHFDVGKLRLTASSVILLYPGASITSSQGTSSDKIEVGGVSKYTGNEGTLAGPLIANGSTTGFTIMPIIVPVRFIAYNVSVLQDGHSLIKWTTTEETNASHYTIERSEDGYNWQSIGQVQAAQQHAIINSYSYTDKKPVNRVVYYRIRQVDTNGDFMYTSVKSIRANAVMPEVKISSAGDNIVVQFSKDIKGKIKAQMISASGQTIQQEVIYGAAGYIILKRTGQKGNYIVRVTDGQGLIVSKQIAFH
jgi:hypothetical protein